MDHPDIPIPILRAIKVRVRDKLDTVPVAQVQYPGAPVVIDLNPDGASSVLRPPEVMVKAMPCGAQRVIIEGERGSIL
jgi:hypothetical protein